MPEKTIIILTFNDRNKRVIVLHANNDQKVIVSAELDQTETTAKRVYPEAIVIDNTKLYYQFFPQELS